MVLVLPPPPLSGSLKKNAVKIFVYIFVPYLARLK